MKWTRQVNLQIISLPKSWVKSCPTPEPKRYLRSFRNSKAQRVKKIGREPTGYLFEMLTLDVSELEVLIKATMVGNRQLGIEELYVLEVPSSIFPSDIISLMCLLNSISTLQHTSQYPKQQFTFTAKVLSASQLGYPEIQLKIFLIQTKQNKTRKINKLSKPRKPRLFAYSFKF